MKAMLFAAGLGTRLRPITDEIPKALVQVNGIPLLEYAIRKLMKHGFGDIIINVHHHASHITAFLESRNNFGANIRISNEADKLLDTGGGLKKAGWFFDREEPFLLYNCDIISALDLTEFWREHLHSDALVTLAVRERISGRYLLLNKSNRLCGWRNVKSHEEKLVVPGEDLRQYGFSGIHAVHPRALELLPGQEVFSLIEFYLSVAKEHLIMGYDHSKDFWSDVGKPEELNSMQKHDITKFF